MLLLNLMSILCEVQMGFIFNDFFFFKVLTALTSYLHEFPKNNSCQTKLTAQDP